MSEPQTSKLSLIPESPPDPSFPEIEPAAAADATRVGDQVDNEALKKFETFQTISAREG